MKKKILSLLLTGLLMVSAIMPVYAEDFEGESGWTVAFDGSKLNSSFSSSDLSEAAAGILPGDSITFTLTLENDHTEATDWWMTNKVLSSFEDNSTANGGAYTYELIYIGADGTENVLYSSASVGGENSVGGEGLHSATGALEDYFYLDTLAVGQSGTLTLKVALDGETQGNAYQNTLANLQLNFAVEISTQPSTVQETTAGDDKTAETTASTPTQTTGKNVVKTGDDTNLMPYIIGMGVSGVIILILAIVLLRRNKKDREKGGSAS